MKWLYPYPVQCLSKRGYTVTANTRDAKFVNCPNRHRSIQSSSCHTWKNSLLTEGGNIHTYTLDKTPKYSDTEKNCQDSRVSGLKTQVTNTKLHHEKTRTNKKPSNTRVTRTQSVCDMLKRERKKENERRKKTHSMKTLKNIPCIICRCGCRTA